MNHKTLWSEGMFLKPQHFQQQDRHFEYLLKKTCSSMTHYCDGFTHLIFNHGLLTVGKIALTSCSGIFPDGTFFCAPDSDHMPEPLELPPGVTNTLVYLAIPLQREGQADILMTETEVSNHRYRSQHYELMDAVADSNQIAEIQVAQLQLKIISEQNVLNNYSYLPLAKIQEVRPDKKIILEPHFIPTCLHLDVSCILMDEIKQLHSLLEHRAQTLAERMADSRQLTTAEILDFSLLQTLNRYEPLFKNFCVEPRNHPYALYENLLQLLGEISSFCEINRRPLALPRYCHHQPTQSFTTLFNRLRQALNIIIERDSIAITLTQQSYGNWTGEILNKELLDTAKFILAVHAQTSAEILRNLFPNHVKIAPVEYIENLVSRALPGIALHGMTIAPRKIPYHSNFCYFELDKNNALWNLLRQSAGISLHVSGHFPEIKLELWAIKE